MRFIVRIAKIPGRTMYLRFSLFAIFVISAYAGSEEHDAEWKALKEQWKAAKEKCVAETGVDLEVLKKLHESEHAEVDRKVKCFGACVMKERGTVNGDGTLNLEKALEQVPQHMPEREKMVEALTACADKKGEDECETAHAIFTCLHEKQVFKHKEGSSEED